MCHSNMDYEMDPESASIELQDLEVAIMNLAPSTFQDGSRNLIRKYFRQICMLMIGLCKPGELLKNWHLEIYELLDAITTDVNNWPQFYHIDALSIIHNDLRNELQELLELLDLGDALSNNGSGSPASQDQVADIERKSNVESDLATTEVTDIDAGASLNAECFLSSQQQMQWLGATHPSASAVASIASTRGTDDDATHHMPFIKAFGCDEVPRYEDLDKHEQYTISEVHIEEELCSAASMSSSGAPASAMPDATAAASSPTQMPESPQMSNQLYYRMFRVNWIALINILMAMMV